MQELGGGPRDGSMVLTGYVATASSCLRIPPERRTMSRSKPGKFLIVNADDLGFARSINSAIMRGYRDGIVTSTSLAPNAPATADAVRHLRDAPGLGIGVHLNITEGVPLSEEGQELATDDGVLCVTPARLIMNCVMKPRLLRAIESEFTAQVGWVVEQGLRPTHLDSHCHIHAFPPIFRCVARTARRYAVPRVRFHREALPQGLWSLASARRRWVSRLLNGLGSVNSLMTPQVQGADRTWGVAHYGRIDAHWLLRIAAAITPGITEIIVHPPLTSNRDNGSDGAPQDAQDASDALCDPRVRAALNAHGIHLVHYGQLPGQSTVVGGLSPQRRPQR